MSARPVQADEAQPDPLDDEVEDDPFLEDEEPDLEVEIDEDEASDEDEDEEDGVDADLEQQLAAEDAGEEDEDTPGITVVPPDAEFDDDAPVAPVEDDDGDDDEIEGLRDGEFVCRGCFMAKRETQLADPDRLLCRDCA